MKRRVTTPVLVAGGISLVSLATGTVFGILAASDQSKYKSQPNNDTAIAGEQKKPSIADVGFGVAALFGLICNCTLHASGRAGPRDGHESERSEDVAHLCAERRSPLVLRG